MIIKAVAALICCMAACWTSIASAQEPVSVSGQVKDTNGNPIIGATVVVERTGAGTTSGVDGAFTISVHPGDELTVSFIGYTTRKIPVTQAVSNLEVVLEEDALKVEDVVVIGYGTVQKKDLTGSIESISGDKITDAMTVNPTEALNGRVSGVLVTKTSNRPGTDMSIQIRGLNSFNYSNEPLYVIDGVPTTSGLRHINPEDIESMSVLTGAAAAALYGSEAANGAIMITTKKGEAGALKVTLSSNTEFLDPFVQPEFQNRYGTGLNGQRSGSNIYSWGERLNAASRYGYTPDDFFETGHVYTNAFTLSGGTDRNQTYFSAAAVNSDGIIPNNEYDRYNFTFRNTSYFLNDKLRLDASASYIYQQDQNMTNQGVYSNPLVPAYLFPRGGDWNYYRDNYEIYDPNLNANVHNWVNTSLEQFDNPYWILNRQKPISERNRYEFGGQVRYDIIEGLSVTGRMRYERADDNFKHNYYASSTANRYPMGRMKDNRYFSDQLYGDVLVNYNHTWGDWALTATAGSSFTKTKTSHVDLWGEGNKYKGPGDGNIYYPNIFTPNNYYGNMSTTDALNTEKRLNAVFATAQVGFKEAVFLDLSARNDWSSALAFTNGCSFFYPSVGASVLLNKLMPMGEQVNLFKLRGSYSIVGNDVPYLHV